MATADDPHRTIAGRVAAFEAAARRATDPAVMARKISATSDRKKYNYAGALQRDVVATRRVLAAVAIANRATFGAIARAADGSIANLVKALLNLRAAGEVAFERETLFQGRDDAEVVALEPAFWRAAYRVDETSCFRERRASDVAAADRRGRSYEAENLATLRVNECAACGEVVNAEERLAVRGSVFHAKCLACAQCAARVRDANAAALTFDGRVCCSIDCLRAYDAAHPRQGRFSSGRAGPGGGPTTL